MFTKLEVLGNYKRTCGTNPNIKFLAVPVSLWCCLLCPVCIQCNTTATIVAVTHTTRYLPHAFCWFWHVRGTAFTVGPASASAATSATTGEQHHDSSINSSCSPAKILHSRGLSTAMPLHVVATRIVQAHNANHYNATAAAAAAPTLLVY
jgi:hypothetical protein